ncbi:hypothetical protein [uncultured Campylobacter sp.]|uniref:hypothetical protein n=1 Tax=uncultured Campylobacter sp. TaxID=218934 RepID=UPI00262BF45C|nr:hypothetical protein [uncultured Campylobacter sp.]
MDYNIANKGFVCFVYSLQRRRAFWAALFAVLAVKFILCELFLGGAAADALVVKLRFATFLSSRASVTVGVFSRSQSLSSVLFRLAQATAWHTGLIRGAAKRDIIAVLKFNRYDYRASRV